MPRELPRFVEKNVVKGHVYLSFRRGKGPRVRLPSDPRSVEFQEAYAAALAGNAVVIREAKREAVQDGTLAALIVSYRKSAGFIRLRATSKPGYISRLDAMRRAHGHRTVKGLTRERIITKILEPYAGQPGAALDTLKKLRILIGHAIVLGRLIHDPSLGIERPKITEVRSWTEEEIEQFEARWALGTSQRLAFALHLFTGQRGSDVHRMTWADIRDGRIAVIPQKDRVKRRLLIEIHPDLQEVIEATERRHVVMLATDYGNMRTRNGFGKWMREAITEAGLPLDCQPHGLRKAAGRRLADVGCSAHEIMAILGHKTLAEAERYTRDANQPRLASSGMRKLPSRSANKAPQTNSVRLGNSKKAERINQVSAPGGAPKGTSRQIDLSLIIQRVVTAHNDDVMHVVAHWQATRHATA